MKKYFEKIYNKSAQELYENIKKNIANDEKTFIITANPETLMIAEKDEKLKKAILDENTIVVPDGIGVVKGSKLLGCDIKQTITGIDLCSMLIEECNKQNKSIFLFGASESVINKLVDVIKNKYPNINICGYENGYVKNKEEVFNKIAMANPDLILVALGIPIQELLIYDNLDKFKKGIFVGVGGSFDVLSGSKKRAPKIFIKLHLEWLYRIVIEPKRMKRFFNSNIVYVKKILKERKNI